jgi:tRNA-2-methylthio-N6-dimethylallyladenosine synthase
MNKSDSERIAAYLEFFGFKNELDKKRAGLVVLNTCGIRQTAENRNYGLIPDIKKENPGVKIILAGCLSERKDVIRRLSKWVDVFLPIKDLPELYKKLNLKKLPSTKKDNIFGSGDYLGIKPKVDSKISAYIPIGNGCDNFCSYCVVPFARGREQYRPANEIIKEAEEFIKNNYKEIILIAQNVNSYSTVASKKDLKYFPNKKNGQAINFAELLDVVGSLSGNYWVHFISSHPKNMSDDLIEVVARGGRIAPHVHLPTQAGDDKILAVMNRKYTAKHYLSLVKKIRLAIPDVGLSSDIIVGFPGETKKQFAQSEKLMRQAKFDMVYTSRFSPRPGTAAYKLKDNVSSDEKARREDALIKILRQTASKNNQKFLNREIVVLVGEKNKRGEWLGRNGQYITVKIKGAADKELTGRFSLIKIIACHDFGLDGEFVK